MMLTCWFPNTLLQFFFFYIYNSAMKDSGAVILPLQCDEKDEVHGK